MTTKMCTHTGTDCPTRTEAGTDCDAVEFELGLGAVLYNDRFDSRDGRDLWHVTGRFLNVDTDRAMYELQDGSHTRRKYYAGEDVLADFKPAGWCLSIGYKPTYFLRRELGVESKVPEREFDDYFSKA